MAAQLVDKRGDAGRDADPHADVRSEHDELFGREVSYADLDDDGVPSALVVVGGAEGGGGGDGDGDGAAQTEPLSKSARKKLIKVRMHACMPAGIACIAGMAGTAGI